MHATTDAHMPQSHASRTNACMGQSHVAGTCITSSISAWMHPHVSHMHPWGHGNGIHVRMHHVSTHASTPAYRTHPRVHTCLSPRAPRALLATPADRVHTPTRPHMRPHLLVTTRAASLVGHELPQRSRVALVDAEVARTPVGRHPAIRSRTAACTRHPQAGMIKEMSNMLQSRRAAARITGGTHCRRYTL